MAELEIERYFNSLQEIFSTFQKVPASDLWHFASQRGFSRSKMGTHFYTLLNEEGLAWDGFIRSKIQN